MNIAYFVNQYPRVSHSFIRREILALEDLGVTIRRYALKCPVEELVDPADRAEFDRTHHVFRQPAWRIAAWSARSLTARPIASSQALLLAVRTGWRSDRGVPRHVAYWVEALVVAAWCRRDRIAHVHAHFGTNSAMVAMLANVVSGIPFSFTVHGPDEFDKPEFLALAEKIRRCAFVVGISSYGRSQLLRWADTADWDKVKVVHCGIDEAFRDRAITPPPDTPRLVCVGRLCREKGQLLLIEAARRLRQHGEAVEIVLAGDGPLRNEIDALIQDLGLEDQVRVTGWISSDRVRRELEQARALVLPSFAEGLPVVIMEAMAAARPVVTTRITGIPELVVPGETGWLVTAADLDALVDALSEVLSAPVEQLADMGRKSRERVLSRHDVLVEAQKLKNHFEVSAARTQSCMT